MRDRFGAKDPRSMMLRFHAQTAGSTLTAQQPDVNVVRVALQALAAVLGGAQSLHTNSRDEALGLPTEESARLALRTQQIIAHETGVTNVADPVGRQLLHRATDRRDRARRAGVSSTHRCDGRNAGARSRRATSRPRSRTRPTNIQQAVERGETIVVGVNRFQQDERQPLTAFRMDPEIEQQQVERLRELARVAIAQIRLAAARD